MGGQDPLLELSNYASLRTIFLAIIRGILVCVFQHFPARFARPLLDLNHSRIKSTCMSRHYHQVIQGHSSFIYFIYLCRKTKPLTFTMHSNLSESDQVKMYLQMISKTVNFLHFFKIILYIIYIRSVFAPKF